MYRLGIPSVAPLSNYATGKHQSMSTKLSTWLDFLPGRFFFCVSLPFTFTPHILNSIRSSRLTFLLVCIWYLNHLFLALSPSSPKFFQDLKNVNGCNNILPMAICPSYSSIKCWSLFLLPIECGKAIVSALIKRMQSADVWFSESE